MLNISSIMVIVGDTDKCTYDDDESGIFPERDTRLRSYRYGVESVLFHYGYDHSLLINDVAILRLNESLKFFDHVKPITLAGAGKLIVDNVDIFKHGRSHVMRDFLLLKNLYA